MDTHAQHEEAILFFRMILIEELNGKLIVENGLRFLERNLMLLQVCRCFDGMPSNLIIRTLYVSSARSQFAWHTRQLDHAAL